MTDAPSPPGRPPLLVRHEGEVPRERSTCGWRDRLISREDPWGNPYIITFDINYDEKTRDSFYRLARISQSAGAAGLNGLANSTPANPNGDFFDCGNKVMVWSAGPDKLIDPNGKANVGVNKDNVLSWKP